MMNVLGNDIRICNSKEFADSLFSLSSKDFSVEAELFHGGQSRLSVVGVSDSRIPLRLSDRLFFFSPSVQSGSRYEWMKGNGSNRTAPDTQSQETVGKNSCAMSPTDNIRRGTNRNPTERPISLHGAGVLLFGSTGSKKVRYP